MEVECEYSFQRGGKPYACEVTKANITSVKTEIKKFNGYHEAGQDNNSVEIVKFWRTFANFIPKGIINAFPNVTILSITNCKLRSISSDDLSEFDNLVEFDAGYNNLKSLPSDLFIGKPKLQKISFSFNHLESISSRLLKPLLKNSLTFVSFVGNRSIDEFYCVDSPEPCLNFVGDLMDLIDKQCSKPSDDKDGFTDKTFDDKLKRYSTTLWTTRQFTDFTIIVDKSPTKEEMKEFHVHMSILGLHSPVFAAMFANDMEESTSGKMKIVDFSPSAVEQFLGFLYTGSVPDDVNAMELFALADKYDVPNLKMLSEERVLIHLSEENALDILKFGHLHSSDEMKEEAFRLIQYMLHKIRLDKALMNDPESLKKLIDAEQLRKVKAKEADDELEFKNMEKDVVSSILICTYSNAQHCTDVTHPLSLVP